jgi:hypothetical protein
LPSLRGVSAARVRVRRRITNRPLDLSLGRALKDVLRPMLILTDLLSWTNGDEDQPTTMVAPFLPLGRSLLTLLGRGTDERSVARVTFTYPWEAITRAHKNPNNPCNKLDCGGHGRVVCYAGVGQRKEMIDWGHLTDRERIGQRARHVRLTGWARLSACEFPPPLCRAAQVSSELGRAGGKLAQKSGNRPRHKFVLFSILISFNFSNSYFNFKLISTFYFRFHIPFSNKILMWI